MKTKSFIFAATALLVLAVSSCQKERPTGCFEDNKQGDMQITPESFDDGITMAWDELLVLGGTENEEFYMENEGVLTFLEEEPFGIEISGNTSSRNPCALNGNLSLNDRQRDAMAASWREYTNCKENAAAQLRQNHARVKAQFENRRSNLADAFRANRISEREFKAAMEKLRNEFQREINQQTAMHRHAIQKCYMAYILRAQKILSPEQFRVFMRCHRAKLPFRR
jgi:hypothetical protein